MGLSETVALLKTSTMTESDKNWMTSEFNRVHDALGTYKTQCDKRVDGLEKWIGNVESDTKTNSKYIWIATGIATIVALVAGILEFSI